MVDAALLPGYWMHETSGRLRPAVEAYLNGRAMSGEHIAAMGAYLRQWIASPYWKGDAVPVLRQAAEQIETAADVTAWIEQAIAEGLDPL